jgi:hypothetical protein
MRPNNGQDRQRAIQDALTSAGVDPSNISDVAAQIKAAVQKAMQSSSGTPDQNRQAVTAAIDGVLKQNGIDPTKFQSAMQSERAAHRGHHGHRGGKPGAVGTTANGTSIISAAPNALTDADGDGDGSAASMSMPLPGGTIDANA